MADGHIHLYRSLGRKGYPVIAHAEINLATGARSTWIETPGEPRWATSDARITGEQLVAAADAAGELLTEVIALYEGKEPHPHG